MMILYKIKFTKMLAQCLIVCSFLTQNSLASSLTPGPKNKDQYITYMDTQKSSSLGVKVAVTTGLAAVVGIGAVLAYKFWPKYSKEEKQKAEQKLKDNEFKEKLRTSIRQGEVSDSFAFQAADALNVKSNGKVQATAEMFVKDFENKKLKNDISIPEAHDFFEKNHPDLFEALDGDIANTFAVIVIAGKKLKEKGSQITCNAMNKEDEDKLSASKTFGSLQDIPDASKNSPESKQFSSKIDEKQSPDLNSLKEKQDRSENLTPEEKRRLLEGGSTTGGSNKDSDNKLLDDESNSKKDISSENDPKDNNSKKLPKDLYEDLYRKKIEDLTPEEKVAIKDEFFERLEKEPPKLFTTESRPKNYKPHEIISGVVFRFGKDKKIVGYEKYCGRAQQLFEAFKKSDFECEYNEDIINFLETFKNQINQISSHLPHEFTPGSFLFVPINVHQPLPKQLFQLIKFVCNFFGAQYIVATGNLKTIIREVLVTPLMIFVQNILVKNQANEINIDDLHNFSDFLQLHIKKIQECQILDSSFLYHMFFPNLSNPEQKDLLLEFDKFYKFRLENWIRFGLLEDFMWYCSNLNGEKDFAEKIDSLQDKMISKISVKDPMQLILLEVMYDYLFGITTDENKLNKLNSIYIEALQTAKKITDIYFPPYAGESTYETVVSPKTMFYCTVLVYIINGKITEFSSLNGVCRRISERLLQFGCNVQSKRTKDETVIYVEKGNKITAFKDCNYSDNGKSIVMVEVGPEQIVDDEFIKSLFLK